VFWRFSQSMQERLRTRNSCDLSLAATRCTLITHEDCRPNRLSRTFFAASERFHDF